MVKRTKIKADRGSTSDGLNRTFDALPDTLDFRDRMYVANLVEVRSASNLDAYRALHIPVLDQGKEGACTGYGLATVVNYLLRINNGEQAVQDPDAAQASARMLYVMAKRYDEWPGEEYDGSSARGAVKGWHKHGVCSKAIWKDNRKEVDIDEIIASDALERPLGAYFRVNPKDLVGMHSAITEAGILFATCRVHEGWSQVNEGDTEIPYSEVKLGGHAFAIVGYDRTGFWIQNSWGEKWGSKGLARVHYSDWLENGCDVWVARLGAPITFTSPVGTARMSASAPRSYESFVYASLRPHIITAENDGALCSTGVYGLTPTGLRDILTKQLPDKIKDWNKKRVMIYAHGGLVSADSAYQYVANYREDTLEEEIYPLAIIWRSDAWTTLKNILAEAVLRRKSEGFLDEAKDFMLDRLDDTIEPITRLLGGKTLWDEMKENASLASKEAKGAARMVAKHLIELQKEGKIDEIHMIGHSAGSILLAPLAQYFAKEGVKISTLSLWAPACTMQLFKDEYEPLINDGKIEAFELYTLDDATERDDDCAGIYHKSLLYLVSHAFEKLPRIPIRNPKGTPLLGLERDVRDHIPSSFWKGNNKWYKAPGSNKSNARHHGDFNDDLETLFATMETITGRSKVTAKKPDPLKPPKAKVIQFRQNLDIALIKRTAERG
ncbi:C1 family peptidase [Rhizobium sp. ARZ01]|uniref:C1 family peptidase n=1 Tax=Rhizobium sp. ARZ01 TaxID=2769313 RepID=UPI00177D250E|nr:C1 family peptidase [Rhizobium sp. ARZ01]MBD9372368.1 C1 family peptidase [Rhizobium sp. ARZ01]